MSETITITTETVAQRLGSFLHRLTNFNASQFEFEFQQSRVGACDPELFDLMLASEAVLAREWDSPDEDNAWADI